MAGEQPPSSGEFASERDEALFLMVADGWANAQDGDPGEPHTGWFALIINTDRELPEVINAFEDELRVIGIDRAPAQLLGTFLLQRFAGQPVEVTTYDDQAQGEAAFNFLRASYEYWKARPDQR